MKEPLSILNLKTLRCYEIAREPNPDPAIVEHILNLQGAQHLCAQLNIQNDQGDTALDIAARVGNIYMVQAYIATNQLSRTTLDRALVKYLKLPQISDYDHNPELAKATIILHLLLRRKSEQTIVLNQDLLRICSLYLNNPETIIALPKKVKVAKATDSDILHGYAIQGDITHVNNSNVESVDQHHNNILFSLLRYGHVEQALYVIQHYQANIKHLNIYMTSPLQILLNYAGTSRNFYEDLFNPKWQECVRLLNHALAKLNLRSRQKTTLTVYSNFGEII
jgi:ankyrin repeat protein